MDDFQQYLDLYAPERQVLRAALDGRLAPSAHFERFFNPPFPEMRTGLNGLSIVGQPLPRPSAATMSDGFVAPPPAWLQRALNALAVRGGGQPALAVDGVAGAATLQAAQVLWQALVEHIPTQSGAAPYLVNVGSTRTVAMARPLLQWIVDQHLVEVPSPSLRVDVGPVELDPPPAPSTSSGAGGTLLVTAAVVAGLWFAARRA